MRGGMRGSMGDPVGGIGTEGMGGRGPGGRKGRRLKTNVLGKSPKQVAMEHLMLRDARDAEMMGGRMPPELMGMGMGMGMGMYGGGHP
ncbi:hypothetical protein LTR86_002662 [Recurvomyces mirabilis]|nr:hypothetical protein LTR86_002662 [Recurvomyces mirabilis]